ncbi:NHL repeat containing protein [Oopsacas minuta]|uniref:NHL repeat containing protein n=1 Tax=Oopsacas minuta TaxID=111878 RepID=A0AAV7JEZ7_9METZ|nr:NHL repeat containing protein [Oopsacas minuta]
MATYDYSFSSELNRIEQELNTKCQILIDMVSYHQKLMQSKISSIRKTFADSTDPCLNSRVRGKFKFDIDPILKSISSAIKLEILIEDKPIVSTGKHNTEDFRLPKDLAIHRASGRIYIADLGNECVKVCGSSGKVVDTIGEAQLKEPHGLLIVSNLIYVTDTELHSVLAFDVKTKEFIDRVGKKGRASNELDTPKGLAINQDDFIYICDHANDRVVIYKANLEFVRALTWDNIKKPLNIEFTSNKMYLLCDSNPCLFIMSTSGEQRAHLPNGYNCNVMPTGFFCVDRDERIVMSCYGGIINIFDKNIFDMRTPDPIYELNKISDDMAVLQDLSTSTDPNILYVASGTDVIVWDLLSAKCIGKFIGNSSAITRIYYGTKKEKTPFLVTCCRDKSVNIFDNPEASWSISTSSVIQYPTDREPRLSCSSASQDESPLYNGCISNKSIKAERLLYDCSFSTLTHYNDMLLLAYNEFIYQYDVQNMAFVKKVDTLPLGKSCSDVNNMVRFPNQPFVATTCRKGYIKFLDPIKLSLYSKNNYYANCQSLYPHASVMKLACNSGMIATTSNSNIHDLKLWKVNTDVFKTS